ncbi:MAG: hypothetical protein ACFFD2_00740 [Promethearchaeota archaeon]
MVQTHLYNKKLLISVGLVIFFSIIFLILVNFNTTGQLEYINEPSTSLASPPITAQAEPFYELRTPIAYNLEGQSVTVYGDINSLSQETPVMTFKHDLLQTSSGNTYVIYNISTSGIALTEEFSLNLNWEVYGRGSVTGLIETRITVYIFHQNTEWLPIHTIYTPEDLIRYTYGWHEYTIPTPYIDYINADEIKIKIELSQQLTQQRSWTQWLYACWFLLECQNDVSLNSVNATEINVITEGFESSDNINALHVEDGDYFTISRTDPPIGGTQHIQFIITYDIGYYENETLLGLRFSHLDWFMFVGTGAYTYNGEISVVGESSDMWLCYIRQMRSDPVIPGELHATFPITGDWNLDEKITLRYDIDYMIETSELVCIKIDWASIQIVRGPDPIVVFTKLNNTIYAQQDAWFNIICLDGKAQITEIRLLPWDTLIGTASGNYLHSQYMNFAGDISISITIRDAEDELYVIPFGEITVLHRPLSISLDLSEDPLLQEFIIQLSIKDMFTNDPLALYPFTKTILQNGSLFRQQNYQTTLDGMFEIHENVSDYLDWNYTVIIETQETSTHEATSVFASIILSQCPPYLYIDNISYDTPLKTYDRIILNYTVICQSELDILLLYKNDSIFLNLPTELGSHSFIFQDIRGFWEYYLYANNSRGFQGYSSPFTLNITPVFSNEKESPLSPHEYFPNQHYQFNITISEYLALNTIFFEWNGTNYTVLSNINNEYYYDIYDLGVGMYYYRWFFNDTSNNWYTTTLRSYIVSIASTELNIFLNGTSSNFQLYRTCYCNITITLSIENTIYFYLNGSLINYSSAPVINISRYNQAGIYNITAYYAGNVNYTEIALTRWLSVIVESQPPQYSNERLSLNSPQFYIPNQHYQFNLTITDNVEVDTVIFEWNGINYTIFTRIGDEYYNNIYDLGVKTYQYRWYFNDTSNNWNSTILKPYTVSIATVGLNIFLNDTSSNFQLYRTHYCNITIILQLADIIYFYLNNSLISSSFKVLNNISQYNQDGIYNITAYYAGNVNYTEIVVTRWLSVIFESQPPQYSNEKLSLISPQFYKINQYYQFNLTIIDNIKTDSVIFEWNRINYTITTRVGDEYYYNIYDLGVGMYQYQWYFNDTSNNWNSTPQRTYILFKATPTIELYLNGTANNYNYGYHDQANITVILSVPLTVEIYFNDSFQASSISPFIYSSIFIEKTSHLITGFFFGNANYTQVQISRWAFVEDDKSIESPVNLQVNPSNWSKINCFNISWENPEDVSNIIGAYYKLYTAPTFNSDGIYVAGNGITLITGIIVSGEGNHSIYVWLKDNAENIYYLNSSSSSLYFDTSPPSYFKIITPSGEISNKTPMVICQVTITGAGINLSSVKYAFSTNGFLFPTNWAPVDGIFLDKNCTIPASDGSNGILYFKVNAATFNKFSKTKNTIRFRASDIVGNQGIQPTASVILIRKNFNFIFINIILGLITVGSSITYYIIHRRKVQRKLKLTFLNTKGKAPILQEIAPNFLNKYQNTPNLTENSPEKLFMTFYDKDLNLKKFKKEV